MGEIPEDIDKIASDIVRTDFSQTEDDPEWLHYLAIARAILAERQRCAEVAEKEAEGYKANGFPQAALGCITTRKAILNP